MNGGGPAVQLLTPDEAIQRLLEGLPQPFRLLIAVSGGSDSIGLLVTLADAVSRRQPGAIVLTAATIDHGLRPQSVAEARIVGQLCQSLDIPHVTRRWDGEKPSSGLSEAARQARYGLLCAVAKETRSAAIVTGHTFDDQLETIAMRSLRRGGEMGPGAAGMASCTILDGCLPLLRPFLSTRRAAIRNFLASRQIGWSDDPSNEDRRFERARLRQDLPAVDDRDAVAHLSRWHASAKHRRHLGRRAASMAREALTFQDGIVARLERSALDDDKEAAGLLIGTLTAIVGGTAHAPSRQMVSKICRFIAAESAARLTAGRVVFEVRKHAVYMARESRGLPTVRLEAGAACVWDGRFHVANRTDRPIVIEGWQPSRSTEAADAEAGRLAAETADQLMSGIPPRTARLALGSRPQVKDADDGRPVAVTLDGGEALGGCVALKRILMPFNCFLPEFDLDLANSLAAIAELASFPPSPLNVFIRKT